MKCEHCGTPMDINPLDDFPYCPKDCAFEIAAEKFRQEEAQKSPEQLAMEAAECAANPPWYAVAILQVIHKQTYCWVKKCPRSWHASRISGIVPSQFARTSENSDEPYGHFCPDCGHSLRNHEIYGVGGPEDKAKKRF